TGVQTYALPITQIHLDLVDTIVGVLTSDDLALGDGSYYDPYTFDAEAGRTYAVYLASDDVDTFLSLGYDEAGMEEIGSNDDYGDTTDSYVVFTADRDGRVYVRANALYEGETGRYTISLTEGDPNDLNAHDGDYDDVEAALDLSDASMIDVGEPVTSRLTEQSAVYYDGTYYEPHVLALGDGETVTITMRSDDFDAYLIVGPLDDGYFFHPDEYSADDDSGGGTDAQFTFTAPWTGLFGILANAFSEGETGTYTLSVTR